MGVQKGRHESNNKHKLYSKFVKDTSVTRNGREFLFNQIKPALRAFQLSITKAHSTLIRRAGLKLPKLVFRDLRAVPTKRRYEFVVRYPSEGRYDLTETEAKELDRRYLESTGKYIGGKKLELVRATDSRSAYAARAVKLLRQAAKPALLETIGDYERYMHPLKSRYKLHNADLKKTYPIVYTKKELLNKKQKRINRINKVRFNSIFANKTN